MKMPEWSRKLKAGELYMIHYERANDSLFLLFHIKVKIKGKNKTKGTKFKAERAHSKH